MKQTKDIIGIVIILIVVTQLLIYISELNFAYSNVYVITFLNIILCILFFWYANKTNRKLLTILFIGLGLFVYLFEFVGSFKGTENIITIWEINEYEIIYSTEEYIFGPGSGPFLKLREKYVLDLFYKDIDQTDVNLSFPQFGITDCFVKFIKTKMEFDLCANKQLE